MGSSNEFHFVVPRYIVPCICVNCKKKSTNHIRVFWAILSLCRTSTWGEYDSCGVIIHISVLCKPGLHLRAWQQNKTECVTAESGKIYFVYTISGDPSVREAEFRKYYWAVMKYLTRFSLFSLWDRSRESRSGASTFLT